MRVIAPLVCMASAACAHRARVVLMRALLLVFICAGAAAQPVCTPLDYAVYKDRAARDRPTRIMLAFDHCHSKALRGYWLGYPQRQAICDAEAQKALEALRSSGDSEVIRFAEGGCSGPVPENR